MPYYSPAELREKVLEAPLRTHAAMTPRGEYRSLLERHLEETRVHADRVHRRMQALADEAESGVRAELEVNPSNLF